MHKNTQAVMQTSMHAYIIAKPHLATSRVLLGKTNMKNARKNSSLNPEKPPMSALQSHCVVWQQMDTTSQLQRSSFSFS